MNKICTSIDQSQKLIELGVDVSTADMCWCNRKLQWGEITETIIAYPMLPNQEKSEDFKYIPAWSLTALLKLIPPGNILLRDALSGKYKCINTVDSNLYDNPVDAAFEMICWLKENRKI